MSPRINADMSPAGFRVLKPGVHSLVEDAGRIGHYGLGLSTSGPADRLSFLWANRLCGNRENSPALEVITGGLRLTSSCQTRIAVTGAQCPVTINGMPAENWQTHVIAPGDTIELSYAPNGVRSYLAVAGGFQISKTFGSAATSEREKIGGLQSGLALKKDDFLEVLPQTDLDRFMLPPEQRPLITTSDTPYLRIVPGWQYYKFPKSTIKQLLSNNYSQSTTSNRMGYRLEGPPLPTLERSEMISEGIVPGAIQLPPDGRPIIMHVEHQTIGGYPKLGNLATVDLWLLAQLPAKKEIRFKLVSRHAAENYLREALQQFESTCPRRLS